ncbi:DsbA family protein Ecym_4660 [Eremothecium cymbalariae DBVPG|uniref:Thioredoxin-like fold domain-containing protein n=1 Tax=Eremothecium cymbalariae (strain CBS 270.75 / DBVPG 7215 / KCTC 17166 / NRRL Y-17582) TaxID=931890 RepID=G8JSF9_ERECY|nr:hypothetical protein Ecym_4660 [Eremothecium cymbalariae DBVPG\
MPLPSKLLASNSIKKDGTNAIQNTIQLYLDYCCPFSGKLFLRWYDEIFPTVQSNTKYQIVIQNVIQPWHIGSQYMCETALAVAKLKPEKFIPFSKALFESQQRWFDSNTADKSRNEIYTELALFAQESVNLPADSLLPLLLVSSDDGNAVVKDVKYFTRYHRQNGVHVTPTLALNGIIIPAIESSTPTDRVWKIIDPLATTE